MDLVTTMEGNTGTRLSTWRALAVRRPLQHYEVIVSIHHRATPLPAIPSTQSSMKS